MRLFTLPGTRATVQCPAQPRPAPSALVGALLLLLTLSASLAWAQPTWNVAPPASICDNDNGSTTGTVTISINPVGGAANYYWRFRKTNIGGGGTDRGAIVGGADSLSGEWSVLRLPAASGLSITLNIYNGSVAGDIRAIEVRSEPASGLPSTFLAADITLFETPAPPGAIDNAAFTQCSGATGVDYGNAGADANYWTITPLTGTFTPAPSVNSTNGIVSVGTTAAGGTFTLNSFNIANGCTSVATSQVITVVGNAAPGTITGGPTTQCAGTNGVPFSSIGANGWAISGGSGASIASGQGTGSVTVNVGTASFTLQAYNIVSGCSSLASTEPITVNPIPAQPGAISGAAFTQCSGSTNRVYRATNANAWEVAVLTGTFSPTVPTIVSSAGDSVTVNVGDVSATATFSLRAYQVTAGCSSTVRTQTITVNPTPATPTGIAGQDTVCSGTTSLVYTATGATHWRVVGGAGWTPATYTAGANFTLTGAGTGAATIQAIAIAGACTSGVATFAVFGKPTPAQPGVITGAAFTQCSGATNPVYRATNANVWVINGLSGAFTTNPTIASSAGDSVTVDVGAVTTTRTFVLNAYQVAAGCSSTVRTQTITVNPTPATPTGIAGQDTVCSGTTSLVYTATGATHWRVIGGAGWTPATYTAGGSFTLTGAGTGAATIQAIAIAGACTSGVATFAVFGKPTPAQPGAISGASFAQCSGTLNRVYRATNANAWVINGLSGAFTTNPTIASSAGDSVTVNVGQVTTTRTFVLNAYQVTAGCSSTVSSQTITVNPIPAPSAAITSGLPGFIRCTGQTGLTFTSTNADFWQLTANTSGATITAGGTTATVTVSAGATAGAFTLEAYNIASGCTSTAVTQVVTVQATPTAPAAIGGAAFTQCSGSGTYVYTSTGANFWSITGPTGFSVAPSISAGQGTASLTVNVGATTYPTNGSFTLNAFVTTANCTSLASSQTITVNATPTIATGPSATFSNAQCVDGTNTVVYSVTNVVGDVYHWGIAPGTGVILASGSDTLTGGTNSITVQWNALPAGTNQIARRVSVRRARAGCIGPVFSQNVTIRRTPNPTISGPTAVSAETFETYSVPAEAGYTYAWSVIGGTGVATTGPTTNNQVSVVIGTGATGPFTVQVIVTNPGTPNCPRTVTLAGITVASCPPFTSVPTVTNAALCAGDQALVTLSPTSYPGTLTWQVSTAGAGGPYSPAPGGITNSPVLISSPLGVGTYHFRAVSTQICSTQFSPPVQVDVSNAPTVGTLTALSQDVCRIFSNRLELPPGSTGGNPVVWELNASPNPLALSPIWNSAPGTETTPQEEFRVSPFLTAPLAPYVNRTATFRARVGLACGEAISNQIGVRIQDSPSGSIINFPAGFDTVCVGDLIQLSARLGDKSRMEGQWFASTSNGAFSSADTNFAALPASDSLSRFTPNAAAANQPIDFRWNVRAGNCPTVDYFTSSLFVVSQPQGVISFPQGSLAANPCTRTATRAIRGTSSGGFGRFEISSVPATPLDPQTRLDRLQDFPPFGLFPAGVYTPAANEVNVAVRLVIGPGDAGKQLRVRWVTSNPYCSDNNQDVFINVNVSTLDGGVNPLSFSGACPGETTPALNAFLGGGSTGTWSAFRASDFATSTGVFSLNTSPTATFTPGATDTLGGGVFLRWLVANPACGSGQAAYFQFLPVSPVPQGNLADTASSAIRICIDDSTNNQDARTVTGVGLWTITGPGTGTFRNPVTGAIDPANPRAYYRPGPGDGNQTFGLTWRITNGACVTPDLNSRLIRVDALSAGAFPDTTTLRICAGDLTPPLGATVANGSIGFWDIIPVPGYSAGAGGFSGGLSNPNARYFSLVSDTGKFVRTRWTATNGVCNPVIVTRDVFVRELSQGGLEAASLIEVCEGDTSPRLGAFVVHGVGRWEAPNPPVNGLNGTFFSPDSADPLTDPRALYIPGVGDVTGATGQAVKTLRWTVTNSTCTPVSYTRNITVFQTPSGGISGALTRSTCFGDPPVAFTATNGPGTTVQWFSSGSGTFSAPTSASTSYTPAQADTNTTVTIRFRVTSAGGCATVEDTVFLNVFRVFADARRSISQICLPSASAVVDSARLTVVGNFSPTSSYVWSVPPGINPSDLSSQIVRSPRFKSRSNMALGTYVFTVQVTDPTRGGCVGTDTVSVTVTDGGSVGIDNYVSAGDTNQVCLGVPFTLRARPSTGTTILTYNWTVASGSGAIVGPNGLDSVRVQLNGSGATFRVSSSTSPSFCVVEDDISITSYAVIQPNLQAASTCPEEPVKVIVAAGLSSATEQCQFLRWFRGNLAAQGGDFSAMNPNFIKETPGPGRPFQVGPGGVLQDTLSYERGGRDPMTGDLAVGNYQFCVFCSYPAGCESDAQAEYAVVTQPQADFVGAPSVDTTTQSSSEVRVSFFNSSVYFRASRATPGLSPPIVTSRSLDVFLWNFGDTASGDLNRAVTDTATHVYTRDGEFTVTLFVADNLGCSSVLPRPSFVKVDRPDFFFPQAFTPDQKLIASPPPGVTADINETFRPLPASIDSNKYEITRFEVFNSKGVLVYDTRSPLGWDGRLSNGDMAETGVYTYVVEVQFFGSAAAAVRRRYTGQVRLLR